MYTKQDCVIRGCCDERYPCRAVPAIYDPAPGPDAQADAAVEGGEAGPRRVWELVSIPTGSQTFTAGVAASLTRNLQGLWQLQLHLPRNPGAVCDRCSRPAPFCPVLRGCRQGTRAQRGAPCGQGQCTYLPGRPDERRLRNQDEGGVQGGHEAGRALAGGGLGTYKVPIRVHVHLMTRRWGWIIERTTSRGRPGNLRRRLRTYWTRKAYFWEQAGTHRNTSNLYRTTTGADCARMCM